jgi:hypothetical protein
MNYIVQFRKTVAASCPCFFSKSVPSEHRIGSLRPPSTRVPLSAIIYLIYLTLWSIFAAISEPRNDFLPERLSVMSSGVPWFAVSQDGIEDDDEFAHASDESLLTGFAGGSEFGVVPGNDRVGAAGDEGCHVEGGAHGRAAAGNGAPAAQRATVAVDRGNTDFTPAPR